MSEAAMKGGGVRTLKYVFKRWMLMVLGGLLCSSCATIVHSRYQDVNVIGAPADGRIALYAGRSYATDKAVSLKRSRSNVIMTFQCGAHRDSQLVETHPNFAFLFGNIVFFSVLGWLVDGLSPFGWDYDDIQFPPELKERCDVEFANSLPMGASDKAPTIPSSKELYVGPCACPKDRDSRGRLCGKRSAYVRLGPHRVYCP